MGNQKRGPSIGLPGFTGIRVSGQRNAVDGIPNSLATIPVFQKKMSAHAIEWSMSRAGHSIRDVITVLLKVVFISSSTERLRCGLVTRRGEP